MKNKVLDNETKDNIISYIKNTYQCTCSDVCKEFNISKEILNVNFDIDFLKSILFHGCKDSTKEKLRQANLGKKASDEVKQKISNSIKLAMSSMSKEKKQDMHNKCIQTKLERYGTWENYKNHVNNKSKQTKLEKYGDENYNNMAKNKQTKLEKYGDENYNNKEKIKSTQFEKYGKFAFNDVEKVQKTMMERYNVKHNWSSSDPKLNGRETCYKNFGGKDNFYKHTISKGRQTKLELYGDEFYSNSEKAQKTMLEKYGYAWYCTSEDCQYKAHLPEVENKKNISKKKNHTFNVSKEEDELYDVLIKKYGKDDVIREYTDDRYKDDETGYLYKCDFFIKSKDLFIELNYHPSHGFHPFNCNSKEDIEKLKILKENNTAWNNTVIDVWTNRDVKKINKAKENKLKYLAIYPSSRYKDIISMIEEEKY